MTDNNKSLSAHAQAAVTNRGNPATLNLDDIFGDVMFTPDGDTVFMSEQKEELLNSGEREVTTMASKATQDGQYQPVQQGGGLYTTQLYDNSKPALTMGVAGGINVQATAPVPYKSAPQATHHLQYAAPKKKSSSSSTSGSGSRSDRKMSEQQKVERRERNREHAKRSRIRKKFLLESLQQSVSLLKEENEKLKTSIRSHLGDEKADTLIDSANNNKTDVDGLLASSQGIANKVLDDPDFSFIKALQTAQQNFVVTDPSLPDNPIVYASQGFLNLTGYSLDQILGRNCRFLQGPETDPKAVERIRKAIEQGNDMSVCLLNYRVDGTTFWNQFFIAALRDAGGNVTNFVGVQCKVSDQYAATVTKQQEEEEEAAANDDED
jgi:PAS domain S-box-containing protein